MRTKLAPFNQFAEPEDTPPAVARQFDRYGLAPDTETDALPFQNLRTPGVGQPARDQLEE